MTESPTRAAWPGGLATGIGSLPGTDPRAAAALVAGELADRPHVPELPGRGPWADLVGRGCALLVDLAAEVGPSGWFLTRRPGRDDRRARALLAEDLDAVEEALLGHAGVVKAQVCGPVTLTAMLELRSGHRAVTDPGARRDVAESLAAGVGNHLRDLARRLPGDRILLQLDEPMLVAVRAGDLPTPSGLGRVAALDDAELQTMLTPVVRAAQDAGSAVAVHSCASRVPVGLLARLGVDAVSLDLTLDDPVSDDDDLLGWLDGGGTLLAGVAPTVSALTDLAALLRPALDWAGRAGLAADRRPEQLVLTPTCGLAAATLPVAADGYRALVAAARRLADDPGEAS